MKIFHRAAKGRDGSLEFMQQRIDQVAAELESPDVPEAEDSTLLALVRDSQRLLKDLQIVHRTKELRLWTKRAFVQINDLPTKQLLGSRDHQASQEMDIRANRPRWAIHDDWVLGRHMMDKLRIMLDDAKRSVKFLTDTAEGLAGSPAA
jgi:hypothetical protein